MFMRDFGGMGGFESLFGGGAPPTESRRGQDIRVTVRLTLQEALSLPLIPGEDECIDLVYGIRAPASTLNLDTKTQTK